jgi:glycine dehydrogenase
MAALRNAPRSTCRRVERWVLPTQRRGLAATRQPTSLFSALDTFSDRHIGPDNAEAAYMLSKLGYSSMDAFVDEAVPSKIRVPVDAISDKTIGSLSEAELLTRAKLLGAENKPFRSYIGMGYHNAVVPTVILRNVSFYGRPGVKQSHYDVQIMENPAWYTQYTPYQAEVAQGRSSDTSFDTF